MQISDINIEPNKRMNVRLTAILFILSFFFSSCLSKNIPSVTRANISNDDNSIKAYIKALSSKDIEEREVAIENLIQIGDEVVPLLIGQMQRGDRTAKIEASWALGAIGCKTAVPSLLDNMRGNDLTLARYSALSIGMIGGSVAVDGLIHIIEDESQKRRWRQAVMALGSIGDSHAIEALRGQVASKNVFNREAAKRALRIIEQKNKN